MALIESLVDAVGEELGVPFSMVERVLQRYQELEARRNRLAALAKNDRVRLLASLAVGGVAYWQGPLQSTIKYRARELMGDPNARWERDGQKLVRVR